MASVAEYHPFAPEVRENPYPYYTELRRHAPVHRIEPLGFWALSRYDDVLYVLKNPQLFSSRALRTVVLGAGESAPDANSPFERADTPLGSDPPVHTRLRNLIKRGFTRQRIAALTPRIQEIAGEAIDRAIAEGEFDLVRDLALPVSALAIAELLGVDPERREDFRRWAEGIAPGLTGSQRDADREKLARTQEQFVEYFSRIIAERRKEPREDLISELVLAQVDNEVLTPDEVLAFSALLLVTGKQHTTCLLGNAALALLEHTSELEKLVADPSLIPNSVEEVLRFDSPVQGLFRQTTRDVELAGVKIPGDAMILMLFGSANRDERLLPDPDRFDVTRRPQGHVAFGFGIHFCLGAPLARLEARVTLETLLSRLRNLRLVEDTVTRIDSIILRGPTRLPLRFDPA